MNAFLKLRRSRIWTLPVGVGIVVVLTVVGGYVEAYPQNHYAGLHLTSHPPVFAFLIPLAATLSLIFLRKHAVAVFVFTVVAAMSWSSLGQLSGATLVPILVALFWIAQENTLRKVVLIGLAGTVALWVSNGALGPFGWVGGPGLTMWPEMTLAAALGSLVSARRLAQTEAQGRRLEAERAREEEVHLIVNRERMRIARELHDVVAHTMAMINIQASAAQLLLGSDPARASDALAEIRSASKSGLGELRSLLAIMRPRGPEEGHGEIVPDLSAIQRLVKDWDAAGMPTTLELEGEPRELPTAVAWAGFRIVQEALTNVVRHADRPTTIVRLRYDPTSLTVEVRNTSMDPHSSFTEGTGSGLIGMQERVRSLAGSLSAGPLEEGGFQVLVVLALPANTSQEGLEPPTFREEAEIAISDRGLHQ